VVPLPITAESNTAPTALTSGVVGRSYRGQDGDMAESITEATRLVESLAPGGYPFRIRVPLVEDECRWFLRAVDDEVIRFRECDPACFRFRKWHTPGPDHFDTPSGKPRHLFSKPIGPQAWLNREYVPHIAAYARAVVGLGYAVEHSSFSFYRKFTRDLISKRAGQGYETDAEFYDAHARIHLQIEAKASTQQTKKLAGEMAHAASLAELPAGTVKEIEYVLDLAPRFLWVVGPGSVDPAVHMFAVTVDGLNARFDPVDYFPEPP
jgi:hypothetical protein